MLIGRCVSIKREVSGTRSLEQSFWRRGRVEGSLFLEWAYRKIPQIKYTFFNKNTGF